MTDFIIQPIQQYDRLWVKQVIQDRWASEVIVVHGVLYRPADLPGFIAKHYPDLLGLVTYHIDRQQCEVVTLDSWRENIGVGTALISAVVKRALQENCARVWLITTNDNLRALGFYQKRGFQLRRIHRNAVERSRALKPEIPLFGIDGIHIKHEIELEMRIR